MKKRPVAINDDSVLCGADVESRNHLIMVCIIAEEIWSKRYEKCGINRGLFNWDSELQWACTTRKGISIPCLMFKAAGVQQLILYGWPGARRFMKTVLLFRVMLYFPRFIYTFCIDEKEQ